MKIKQNKIKYIVLFILIIVLSSYATVSAEEGNKTIIVVTDKLDFELVERLNDENKMSLGLMNTRTSNVFKSSKESYFMTIATGRRVDLKEDLFKGVTKNESGELLVQGYEDIISELNNKYKGFSREMDFLADTLANSGINVAYIGNDVSALIAADKNGVIHFGDNTIAYNENWMINKTDYMLETSDVLVLSYDFNDNVQRTKILTNYLNKYSEYNVFVFPKEIAGDIDYMRNITLVPILYNDPDSTEGLLTSDSTKREGLILNMDILSELADIYNIKLTTSIGHKVKSISNSEVIEVCRHNLEKYLNSIIIKYMFHGYIVIVQLYILYDILVKKRNNYNLYSILMNGVIISIFLSVVLGIFNINRNIILYCTILIVSTVGLTFLLNKRKVDVIEKFSIYTNVIMLIGIYFSPDTIYNSSFGFNNVVSGGRFYGLNNEAMGVLLVTSIITFFTINKKVNHKATSILALIIYFPIIIVALSGRYAANFGGLLTSIVLFLILLYTTIFDRKITKKNMVALIAIGCSILIINLYLDINAPSGSHAGSLFTRIMTLGFFEFIDMIVKKIKQLTLMTISPPWSIIAIIQVFFVRKFLIKRGELTQDTKLYSKETIENLYIIFITSIVVLLLNDTGVVAFVYMNVYLVCQLIGLHNTKRR